LAVEQFGFWQAPAPVAHHDQLHNCTFVLRIYTV
jgi:hypothetical protein